MAFQLPRERIRVKPVDAVETARLAAEIHVSPVTAAILIGRGLTTYAQCERFFNPRLEDLHDPFLFAGMEGAVTRIGQAIDRAEQIMIYGDYDVDGITATALMMRVLAALGARCGYHLPNRLTQGYGVSIEGVDAVAATGATLMITVDCGVTAIDEVAHARKAGLEVIVTDHHEPKESLPGAIAVLDPKIPGCGYPDPNLAGVGVAFKLCQALCIRRNAPESTWSDYLDIVALGTAADIVPMTGENRILTAAGFHQMRDSKVPGIRALIACQELTGVELSTHHVVFQLAPCINAVGRLGDPRRGAVLLLTGDESEARTSAAELVAANTERRVIHRKVEEDACAWVERHGDPLHDNALVVSSETWHVGVIGIVASKLVERFYRPSILFCVGDDGMARGSGRSVPGLHLLDALTKCSDLLESFGGHAAAAGMNIRADRIDEFRMRLNTVVGEMLPREEQIPTVTADCEAMLPALTNKMVRTFERMGPFGPGNMRPVLVCRNLAHRYPPRVVGTSHIKLNVTNAGVVMDAIAFNMGHRMKDLETSRNFSMAFSLEENEWNGRISLQMRVKGIET